MVTRIRESLNKDSSFWLFLLFSVVAGLVIIAPTGAILMSGDFGWALDFSGHLNHALSTWDDGVGLGYPAARQHAALFPFTAFGAFFEYIGVSNSIFQRLYLFLVVFGGLSGIYGISREYGFPRLQAIFASLCYGTSAFATVYVTPSYGFQFPVYFLLPVAIWLLLSFIRTPSIGYLVCYILLPINPPFGNPVLFIVFFGLLLLFGSVAAIFRATVIHVTTHLIVKRSLIFLSVVVLVNMFWIVPFIADLGNSFESASNAGVLVQSDAEIARQDSLTIWQAMFGMAEGYWPVTGEQDGDYYYDWHGFALSPINILVHGAMMVAVLLFFPKQGSSRTTFFFLLTLFLVAILIVAGLKLRVPLRWPMDSLISNQYAARAFRALFLKFGLFLALSWSLLVSYGLAGIVRSLRIRVFPSLGLIVALAALFVVGYPLYSIQTFKKQDAVLPSHWVKIPEEYYFLRQYYAKLPQDAPLLVLPIYKSYNVLLSWDGSGYLGGDFIRGLWRGPVLYGADKSPEKEALKECLEGAQAKRCLEDIKKLGIQFVLIRKDINPVWNKNENNTQDLSFLEAAGGAPIVFKGQYFDLFQISGSNPTDFVVETTCSDFSGKAALQNEITANKTHFANNVAENSYRMKLTKRQSGYYDFELGENSECEVLTVRKRASSGVGGWVMCLPSDSVADDVLPASGEKMPLLLEKAVEKLLGWNEPIKCTFSTEKTGWRLSPTWVEKSHEGGATKSGLKGILYFAPQVFFYIGLFISVIGTLGVLIIVALSGRKRAH